MWCGVVLRCLVQNDEPRNRSVCYGVSTKPLSDPFFASSSSLCVLRTLTGKTYKCVAVAPAHCSSMRPAPGRTHSHADAPVVHTLPSAPRCQPCVFAWDVWGWGVRNEWEGWEGGSRRVEGAGIVRGLCSWFLFFTGLETVTPFVPVCRFGAETDCPPVPAIGTVGDFVALQLDLDANTLSVSVNGEPLVCARTNWWQSPTLQSPLPVFRPSHVLAICCVLPPPPPVVRLVCCLCCGGCRL